MPLPAEQRKSVIPTEGPESPPPSLSFEANPTNLDPRFATDGSPTGDYDFLATLRAATRQKCKSKRKVPAQNKYAADKPPRRPAENLRGAAVYFELYSLEPPLSPQRFLNLPRRNRSFPQNLPLIPTQFHDG